MTRSRKSTRVPFIPKSLATRQLIACLLALLIFIQPIALFATSRANAGDARWSTTTSSANDAINEATPREPITTQTSSGIELTALTTAFTNHTGIDYHQRTRKVVVSANSNLSGQPNNFELIQADGVHASFGRRQSRQFGPGPGQHL